MFKRKCYKKKIFFNLFLVTFLVLPSLGQDVDNGSKSALTDRAKENLRLFDSDKLLKISLRFDLTYFLRKKPTVEYIKAIITFHLSESDSIDKNIKLRSRGEFRNQYCYYPPVELNFKKADLEYGDFNKTSKIKLVVQCKSGAEFENYIFREYLIYKLFNVLTDTCFRVRLLSVNFINTQKEKKPTRLYGFFIEPVEMLATRTNSAVIKTSALNQKSIKQKSMDRVAIFNYMIGNYDWAVPNQHNVKVLKSYVFDTTEPGLGLAVPYDFDWTGLVNASYALPVTEITGTTSVRERIFLGVCRSKEVFQKDLEEFVEKKEEFYRVINEFPYLNQNSKKDIIKYLDEFYSQIENKNTIINIFLNKCKNF